MNDWTDWGFGIWPPENWEPLLNDTLNPSQDEIPFDFDMGWNLTTQRVKESAERRQDSAVSLGLASRLRREYPVCDLIRCHCEADFAKGSRLFS